MITSAQVRAAKALIRWSGNKLAERACVTISSILRIEVVDGLPDPTIVKILHAIQATLETAGVEFIGTPGAGARVRLALGATGQNSLFPKQSPNWSDA